MSAADDTALRARLEALAQDWERSKPFLPETMIRELRVVLDTVPTPVADDVRKEVAHVHAPGIWCDDCLDAPMWRIHKALFDHAADGQGCTCGWTMVYDGTPHQHRRHVAESIHAALATETVVAK